MAGFKIQLPEAVTDTTMKILYPDSIMSNGSLFLFDASHPLGESGTTIINGGKAQNIAYKEAAAIIGSGDISTLSGDVVLSGVTPSTAIIEMTAKKGVHGIISQTNTISTLGWQVNFPTLIKTHLLNSWVNKKLYISLWGNTTRISNTTSESILGFVNVTTGASNYKSIFRALDNLPLSSASRVSPSPSNVVGRFFRNQGDGVSVGITPTSVGAMRAYFKIGVGAPYDANEKGNSSSRIIYRVYIEDLDVSGRTYTEVDAIDKAMYDSAFAIGGKFYNDTFTSPTVLP